MSDYKAIIYIKQIKFIKIIILNKPIKTNRPSPIPYKQKPRLRRVRGNHQSSIGKRTLGNLSSVSATKKKATDDDGDEHMYTIDAKRPSFVSSHKSQSA